MKLDGGIVWRAAPKEDWAEIDRQWNGLKRAVLAYHVGCWRKGEPPLHALARALDIAPEETLGDAAQCEELERLSGCLSMGWDEQPGLNIAESVALTISLLNDKLAEVPLEVRAFFGAPAKLESPPSYQPTEGAGFLQHVNSSRTSRRKP